MKDEWLYGVTYAKKNKRIWNLLVKFNFQSSTERFSLLFSVDKRSLRKFKLSE